MSLRNRPRRSPDRLRPMAGSRRPPRLIVELAANAPAEMMAAVEEAIQVASPLADVELVRIRAMALPKGEPIRIRAFIAWDAPAAVQRRQAQAMTALMIALDAALAVFVDGRGQA